MTYSSCNEQILTYARNWFRSFSFINDKFRISPTNNELKWVLISKFWTFRSEEAQLVFFCFCNLWLTCFPFSSHYLHKSEGQKQKYSSLHLHPAMISLFSVSHHIRILIYTIWLWILKSSVPFKILFKFKAPPPFALPLMKAAQERGYETRPTVLLLDKSPSLSPFSSLKARGIFWCIRCVRNN